ncbi:MAG TPA: response regulator transcription factor [Burkholderiaceae bacterium]|nr:response regulator transcription factor [Burkholderiaceae bacterium]
MIRVLIADDHTLFREGLKQLLSLTLDISVAGEVADGDETLEVLQQGDFDLLLLDVDMPGLSGVGLLARVRLDAPALPILMLSMHNEPQIAKRLLKAGAGGYLTKDSALSMVITAIRRVAAGGNYIAPDLAEQIAIEACRPEPPLRHHRLSKREARILGLLVQGKNINEIGEMLFISSKTVSTHKSRLMQKMEISNNSELLRYGLTHNLAA